MATTITLAAAVRQNLLSLQSAEKHNSLKEIPSAMTTGIGATNWSAADLPELVEATLPKPGTRGPYKKAQLTV